MLVLFKTGILFKCKLGLVNGADPGIRAPVLWLPCPTVSPALPIYLPVLRKSFVSFWTFKRTSSIETRPFGKKFVLDTFSVKARAYSSRKLEKNRTTSSKNRNAEPVVVRLAGTLGVSRTQIALFLAGKSGGRRSPRSGRHGTGRRSRRLCGGLHTMITRPSRSCRVG